VRAIAAILGRIGLIVAGLLIPFVILEIVARAFGLAPPPIPDPTIWDFHPQLGWWHIPNSGGVFYSSFNEYETEVRINGLGLRDDESLDSYDIPDRFKLLVLADSFGEALQVPLEKTFYKQLQAKLTENGPSSQTINAGVGSWGTDQEATYYAIEGHKFNPDLTLLFFFTRNDTVNSYAPLEIARNGGHIQKSFYTLDETGNLIPPEPFDPDAAYDNIDPPDPLPPAPCLETADWLWLHSHLYRWLAPYLRDTPTIVKWLGPSGLLGGEGRIRATHPAIPVPFYVYQTPLRPEWERGWNLIEAILSNLRDHIEEDGGKFAVVIIPAREQVYPAEWEHIVANNSVMRPLNWNLELPNQILGQILTRQQIPYLDLLPPFRAVTNDRLYFTHDGHWTEAGHTLAAEAIFTFLYEENLVEQKTKQR
jgi:hypothetical protein